MDTRHPHLDELAFQAPTPESLAAGYGTLGTLLDQGDRTAVLAVT